MKRSRMYFWYGFVFIWDSVGMWTSAFGTLYATLLPKLCTVTPSNRNPMKNLLLHPITLNTLCFLPPLGLAITQIATSIYSSAAWSNIVHTQFKLIGDLKSLGVQWGVGGEAGLQKPLHKEAIELGNLFLEQKEISQTAFQRNAGTCAGWYLLCILLFAPTAIWLLLVIRHAIKIRTSRTIPNPHPLGSSPTRSSLACPVPTTPRLETPRNGTFPPPSPNRMSFRSGMKPPAILNGSSETGTEGAQQDTSTKELRRAFYTVGLQSAVTLFCMTATAGSWLWVCIDASEVIVTPTLHAFAILFNVWIFVVVGCLVNVFILIRTYRSDDQGTQHSSGHVVPMSPMSPMRPKFASSTQNPMVSDKKSILVHASTSTHTIVDLPSQRSVNTASQDDLRLTLPRDPDAKYGSAYSLSTLDLTDPGEEKRDGVESEIVDKV
ncbi:hypothetical protein RhiJN_05414 [Ceratobasidium sp. AG-Ba]|nr:hypothetical protein RhiJN_05414 [Ceratobasidium sp. AG-Ba]QRW06329.1 hypothetical protein RhiLY_05328 [Ceratobasidium sp. AG-Ba]